jgi:hypothetical protein
VLGGGEVWTVDQWTRSLCPSVGGAAERCASGQGCEARVVTCAEKTLDGPRREDSDRRELSGRDRGSRRSETIARYQLLWYDAADDDEEDSYAAFGTCDIRPSSGVRSQSLP